MTLTPWSEMPVTGLAPVMRLGGVLLPLAGRARVYACGITPYDVTHLGHAATFVWTDTLCRVVRAGGAEVAEAFTGVTPFARARMNAGVVRVAGAKMAKSAGNLVLVRELLAGYPAAAVRLLILDRRWDQDWAYERAGLEAAAARLERLQAAAGRPDRATAGHEGSAAAAVRAALADDLDVPGALRIAEEAGGSAARSAGSLLGLW